MTSESLRGNIFRVYVPSGYTVQDKKAGSSLSLPYLTLYHQLLQQQRIRISAIMMIQQKLSSLKRLQRQFICSSDEFNLEGYLPPVIYYVTAKQTCLFYFYFPSHRGRSNVSRWSICNLINSRFLKTGVNCYF